MAGARAYRGSSTCLTGAASRCRRSSTPRGSSTRRNSRARSPSAATNARPTASPTRSNSISRAKMSGNSSSMASRFRSGSPGSTRSATTTRQAEAQRQHTSSSCSKSWRASYHIDDFSRDELLSSCRSTAKPFVVMPYTRYLNDLVHYALQPGDLAGYERTLNEEFAALYEEAATRRRMMVISFHDKLTVRLARVRDRRGLHRASADAEKRVWFALRR